MAALSSALLAFAAAGLLLMLSAPTAAQNCTPSVLSSGTAAAGYRFTVNPWIIPSTNLTNGSLPPGTCPFASYPMINATCKDSITIVTRAVPSGQRVHGIYLLNDEFVDQRTGAYRCPSTAVDVDLRNGTGGGFANPAACRGASIVQVQIDGTSNFTAPFNASSNCAGYTTLDPLAVYVPTAPANCSTATVIVGKVPGEPSCFKSSIFSVKFKSLVKKGTSKYLVFACPQIAGNQPGGTGSHCAAGKTPQSLVVRVSC